MAEHGSDSSEVSTSRRRTTRRIRRTTDESAAAAAEPTTPRNGDAADAEATEAPRRRTRRTRTTEEPEATPAPAPRPRRSRGEAARAEAARSDEGRAVPSEEPAPRAVAPRATRVREEVAESSSFGEGLLDAFEVPKRSRRREESDEAPVIEPRRTESRDDAAEGAPARRMRRTSRSRDEGSAEAPASRRGAEPRGEAKEERPRVSDDNAHDREWFEREPFDFDSDVPPAVSSDRAAGERAGRDQGAVDRTSGEGGPGGFRGRSGRGGYGQRRESGDATETGRQEGGRPYGEPPRGEGDRSGGDVPSTRGYGDRPQGERGYGEQGDASGEPREGGRRRRRRRRRGGADRGPGGEGSYGRPANEGYAPREGQPRSAQERYGQEPGPAGGEDADSGVEFFDGAASYGGNEGGQPNEQGRPYEGGRGYSQNRQNDAGPGGQRRRRRRGRGGDGQQQNAPHQNGRRGNDSMQTSRRRTRGGQQGRGQFQGQQGRDRGYRERSVPQNWHNNDVGGEVTGTFDGVLELHSKGFGFLRDPKKSYFAADSDPFVTGALVEKYKLREGVMIHGGVGPGTRGQGPRLKTIETIDGRTPEEYALIKHFDDLTPINPFEQIRLETGPKPVTMRVMDLLTPIGKGQRALIVAPPRSGKTMLLQDIADAVSANHPELHLIVVLIDERPEEVTELKRRVRGEVIASSMDRDVENHIRVSQLIFERAKRLVEAGGEVFVLLDSITRLGRAFNKGTNTGRTTQGGIDVRALDIPRKLFGTARRFDEGGSLTVVGTALIDTGSKGDEVIFQEFKGTGNMELVLSRQLSDRRIWPAMDISMSGTRREEKILPPDVLEGVTRLRRMLVSQSPVESMEGLIRVLSKFPSNKEFLAKIQNLDLD